VTLCVKVATTFLGALYKKLIVNKKCCREKLVLERRLVCKKKAKNCVKINVAANAKT
jgi:hypothetical protein